MSCLQSLFLSLFVYIRNDVCIIYVHGILYMELLHTVDPHVKFCTASSLDFGFTCSWCLCYICGAFFITSVCYINSETHDLLGVQKITCILKQASNDKFNI